MTLNLSRRSFLLALAGATAQAGGVSRPAPARAQATRGDWEPAGITQPVARIVLAGDAAFVLTADPGERIRSLWRGAPGGTTWAPLSLPAEGVRDLAVALAGRDLLLAAGDGVYRSADAGRSWQLALTAPSNQDVTRVAISPAVPRDALAVTVALSSAIIWRSADGGNTWQRLRSLEGALCGWVFPVVELDPAIPRRLYLSYYCAAGRNFAGSLQRSDDLWQTDPTTILPASPSLSAPLGLLYPQQVAFDPAGQRGLVLARRDARAGGSTLLRTPDGGATWERLLDYPATGDYLPNVLLQAFASQPDAPDEIYVGLGGDGRGVLGSADGGATWGPVGTLPIGPVRTLAYDAAADRLYAGTDQGLWALSRPATAIRQPPAPSVGPWPSHGQVMLEAGDDITLDQPHALALDNSGALLVATRSRLVYLLLDGSLQDAPLGARPLAGQVAIAADGAIIFTEPPSSQTSLAGAYRLAPDGRFDHLAGGGQRPPTAEPQPALDAQLSRPAGIAVNSQGRIFLADSGHHTVCRLDPDGSLRVVAGTGRRGWSGEGYPATETDLDEPWGLALTPDGRLLIADRAGQRVLRLEPDGTLNGVAGTGLPGTAGDGGPATAARLAWPSALATDPAGRIFIADPINQVIRAIDVDGSIWSLTGDRASALRAPIAVTSDGASGLYVAELGANRVTWLEPTPG